MTRLFNSACCLFFPLAFSSVAAAEVPDLPDEIVVSATLTPTLLSETGSAVTVITAGEIKARQYVFLVDALRDAPGVSVARNGGAGGAASARIRGASSGQSLVVIDGVNVNDPSAPQGGFNFANLDVAGIERVEVLRGPQSLIYGADAIGGVISITTKKLSPFAAYLEGGSRGTLRGAMTVSAGNDAAYGRATFSGVRTDGVSRADGGAERDGYRSLTGSLTGGVRLNDHWSAELIARIGDSHAEIDGFPAPAFTFADTDETEETRDYLVAGKLMQQWNNFEGALTVSHNALKRENFDAGAPTFAAQGSRSNAIYVGALTLNDQARLIAGGEFEQTRADVSGVDEHASAGAAFALVEVSPFEALTLSAGARRDEFSNFDGATTARVAGIWDAGNDLFLRASWGQGFRAPSLFELNFDQFGTVPNPDLQPEKANGFDVGLEKRFGAEGRQSFAVTFFHTRVRDQIDFDFAGSGYFNIDETRARGVEASGSIFLNPNWSVQGAYTFTDAIDISTGDQLPRQPRHQGNLNLSWRPTDSLNLSASANFNGRENDAPAGNDAFATLNLLASYAVTDALELYGRIENATDADYQDVSGYGEPGLSAYAGIRVGL